MFGSIGFTELILILVIVLIIFGAGKLPQLGEGLGKAIKGFKKSVHEADSLETDAQAQPQVTPAQSSPIAAQTGTVRPEISAAVPERQAAAMTPTPHA
jgi:sec-independent protein translocase protein TatA